MVSGTGLYFTWQNDVSRCDTDASCSDPDASVIATQQKIHALSAAGNWFAFAHDPLVNQSYVRQCLNGLGPLNGSQLTMTAIDDPNLCYGVSEEEIACCRLPCNQLSPSSYVTRTPGTIAAMLLVGSDVVWVEQGQTIRRCPVTGCADGGSPLVANAGDVRGLARDGAKLYWTTASATGVTVSACSLDACTQPAIVASGLRDPSAIALDDAFVHWTDLGNGLPGQGKVLRVAK